MKTMFGGSIFSFLFGFPDPESPIFLARSAPPFGKSRHTVAQDHRAAAKRRRVKAARKAGRA